MLELEKRGDIQTGQQSSGSCWQGSQRRTKASEEANSFPESCRSGWRGGLLQLVMCCRPVQTVAGLPVKKLFLQLLIGALPWSACFYPDCTGPDLLSASSLVWPRFLRFGVNHGLLLLLYVHKVYVCTGILTKTDGGCHSVSELVLVRGCRFKKAPIDVVKAGL